MRLKGHTKTGDRLESAAKANTRWHEDLGGNVGFQSRVNDDWLRHEDAVICTYDLAKFDGDTRSIFCDMIEIVIWI